MTNQIKVIATTILITAVTTAAITAAILIANSSKAVTGQKPQNKKLQGECPVCYETVKLKKFFACNHGICKNCFKRMRKAAKKGNFHETTSTHEGATIHDEERYDIPLKCPMCRAPMS
jgi:hypothetical protein